MPWAGLPDGFRMPFTMPSWLIKFLSGLLVAGVVGAAYLSWAWNHGLKPGTGIYEVKPGLSLRGFARELNARGVLPESHSFVWLAHLTGRDRGLKTRQYRFRHGTTRRGVPGQGGARAG